MRMKDKKSGFLIFAVVIVAVVVLAVTCSGGSDKEESNKEAKGSSKTTTESTSDQTTSKTQTTVTKGNVYNKKNLVIDVDKFDDANTAIWFRLQNKSSANWTIYASAYSINGIMTNNNMFDLDCEIAKGKKANAKLELDTDFMEDMGMKDIEFVDIKFQAVDSDEYTSFYTDVIRIPESVVKPKKIRPELKRISFKAGKWSKPVNRFITKTALRSNTWEATGININLPLRIRLESIRFLMLKTLP